MRPDAWDGEDVLIAWACPRASEGFGCPRYALRTYEAITASWIRQDESPWHFTMIERMRTLCLRSQLHPVFAPPPPQYQGGGASTWGRSLMRHNSSKSQTRRYRVTVERTSQNVWGSFRRHLDTPTFSLLSAPEKERMHAQTNRMMASLTPR